MKLFKSPLRRSTAVLAGAFIGMAGAVAIAAPASAHVSNLSVASSCIDASNNWVLTWSLKNSENDLTAVLEEVAALPLERSDITGIVDGATLPMSGDGPLVGVQTLKPSARNAYLRVQSHWKRPQLDGSVKDILFVSTNDAKRPSEKCTPTPQPTEPTPTPPPTEPTSSPAPPSQSPTTPRSEPAPTEAQWIYDETCDKLTVGVEVPADWDDLTVTFKPSTGESKTVTAPAGQETVVDFPASAGLKVVATAKGYEEDSATITYKEPADCDSAGGGGGLPVTGAAAGGIAGGAAVLLAIGGFLFVMARRRKVKFTA